MLGLLEIRPFTPYSVDNDFRSGASGPPAPLLTRYSTPKGNAQWHSLVTVYIVTLTLMSLCLTIEWWHDLGHVTRWEVDVLTILWLDFLVSFLIAGWWDEMSGVGRAHRMTMTLDTVAAWWYAARRHVTKSSTHAPSVRPSVIASGNIQHGATLPSQRCRHQWHHNKHKIHCLHFSSMIDYTMLLIQPFRFRSVHKRYW